MLKRTVSKYFFTSTVLISCFLLFYIFVAFNGCILGNLKLTLRKYERDFGFFKNSYRNEDKYETKTVVRVVPLSWQNEKEENMTDGSPKYRFLLQQGLTPSRKLPDALIIGVKKGGTRALLEFVRLHPDVRAAGSEMHFFDKHYWKGFQWYRRRMPATLQGQVTMEKTPSYFITKEVPKRVYKMNPATKLIVVVRDPVTRAISDYTQATSGERLIMDPAAEITRVQDFLGLKRIITEKYFYFNATKGFPCLIKSEGRSTPHCLGKTKGRNHPPIRMYALMRLRNFYRPFNEKFYQMTGINFGWP